MVAFLLFCNKYMNKKKLSMHPYVPLLARSPMNLLLQSFGIKVGYGRPQGQSGGRDGTVSAGGGCCS